MHLQRIESKQITNLASLADLLTLIEQGKLVLFANIKSKSAIARRLAFSDQFVGMATASVNTFVPLSSRNAKTVIRNGETSIKRVRVRASQLTDWNPQFPYEDLSKVEGIDDWEGTDYETAKRKSVELLLEPSLDADFSQLADIFIQFASSKMADEKPDLGNGIKRLSSKGYTVTKLDLFVDADKLQAALKETAMVHSEDISDWQALSEREIASYISAVNEQPDPLNIILFRIVADNPQSPMKALWAQLEHDHENELRRYDTDHLIDHFESESFHWIAGKRLRPCSYRSAGNRISKVKQAVKIFFSQKVS